MRLVRAFLIGIAGLGVTPRTLRWALYRVCGFDIQTRAVSAGCSFFSPPVHIARGCFINVGCFFDASASITIEAGCSFGPQVALITSTHEVGGHKGRAAALTASPITIGAGTWIGARATVLPGVTVGPGCIIAAGSVVTKDCEPDTLYAGVPARPIRSLSAADAVVAAV